MLALQLARGGTLAPCLGYSALGPSGGKFCLDLGTLDRELAFEDVPWPVCSLQPKRGAPSALGADAIAKFLLPRGGAAAKERRVRLREALLRFHPDKFEGRCLRYVRAADQERVREGVAEVTRGINALLLQ